MLDMDWEEAFSSSRGRGFGTRITPVKALLVCLATGIAVVLALFASEWIIALVLAVLVTRTLLISQAPRCPRCGRRKLKRLFRKKVKSDRKTPV